MQLSGGERREGWQVTNRTGGQGGGKDHLLENLYAGKGEEKGGKSRGY